YNETKELFKNAKQALKENEVLKTKNEKLKKENVKMNYKIKKYTESQLENLRQIPIEKVAEKLGFTITEKSGSYVRFKASNLNLVIDTSRNSYVDNTSEKKGFGAINFLRDFANYNFKQAIELLANDFSTVDIARELAVSNVKTEIIHEAVVKQIAEIPKENPLNTQNVVNYLTETRAIDQQLVKELIDNKRLYADKLNNCVFTNEDKTFAFIRGTHKEKRFVANKGQLDFIRYKTANENENLYLFESVIDLLSYRTLNPEAKGTFVSIQGSALSNRLPELGLNNYKNVICCFDNDDQGKRFDEKVKEIVPTATVQKPGAKDFNEELIAHKKKAQTQVQNTVDKIQQEKLKFGKNKTRGLTL
ncbi:MAG: DUF3991 and toprim domain-containing protein, partial [Sulfurihydrogenibium sp.]|nr:DUF3991 and toprim domain-containing protein [Sulfurihydrogenibium sp.]